MDYLNLSLSSIKQTTVNGEILELNGNLCRFLVAALIETEKFLHQRINELSEPLEVGDKRRAVLLQLYYVVKQAETLVLKCCESQSPAWPERALSLLGIKEDILDIVLHLRWWESILDIAIAATRAASSPQTSVGESVKSANQKFEETLDILTSSSNELQEAAVLDEQYLVQLIHELQRSYAGEPGTREHYAYLLSIQIHSLLTDKEVGWISELNDYKYVGTIGSGGFGAVLQVEWCGYDCALKIFTNIRHNQNEAESLKKCRHPHIVQCYRHWEPVIGNNANTSGQSHILMERMPKDLATHISSVVREREASSSGSSEVLKEKPEHTPILPFSNPVAIDVMLQVSKAMWYMHSKGIIHRDLKPSNVLMRPVSVNEVPELSELGFLQVKLADFGLARGDMMSSNYVTLSRNAGSTLYRAPELSVEQYLSGRNYPRKADLWSFGIMCAAILSGLRPFESDMPMGELKTSITDGLRPRLPGDCPDYLKICIESCWKLEPTERPRFSEIWKMLRFAKLRSLGIIEQNYDLFTFEGSSHRPLLVRMPLSEINLRPSSVTPQPPLSPSPSRKKKIGFWTSILLKLGLIKQTKSQDPSAHLESSFQKPLNFLVNQVWPPENSTETIGPDTPGIDVIFFEGNVGGRSTLSCRDTWLQRKKPYAWWPQDWLPHDVEGNIRVLVLEYCISDVGLEGVVEDVKANLIFSGTWSLDHTWQRPIVLVGHSLGCTAIEALVVDLDQNAQQFDLNSVPQHDMRKAGISRAFLNNLAGCFFYAPPCQGLAQSPALLKYVFGGLTYSDELFQSLRVGYTEAFSHFRLDFRRTHNPQIRLMALIEGCQTKGRFVVTETAIKGLGIEYSKLEDSNHSEVCKPVDKTHVSYKKLVQFIADCAKDAEAF